MTPRTTRHRLVRALAGCVAAMLLSPVAAGAQETPPAPLPDPIKPGHILTLSPGQTITQHFDDLIVGSQGANSDPTTCSASPDCDMVQLRFNRDHSPGALNFAVVKLEWDPGPEIPDLVLVVAGLGIGHLNDLDMYVWDDTEARLGSESAPGLAADTPVGPVLGPIVLGTPEPVCVQICFLFSEGDPSDPDPGGHGVAFPEIAGFTVTQDKYDLVIAGALGVMQGYTLTVKFSNELFPNPLEVLEDDISAINPAESIAPPAAIAGLDAAPPLASSGLDAAPIGVDRDFAGFGLGSRNELDLVPSPLPSNLRRTVAAARPPSDLVLWLWLAAAPIGLVAVAAVLLRRRRQGLT